MFAPFFLLAVMMADLKTGDRHSIRLGSFDYSKPGAYFITICVKDHKCLFGRIAEGKMELNRFGEVAQVELMRSPEIRKEILIDTFAIMPNHIHILAMITVGANDGSPFNQLENRQANGGSPVNQSENRWANGRSPLPRMRRKSISSFVAGYKSSSTKRINILRGTPGADFWQRNYYEHIIRNESELNKTRQYIQLNPVQWQFDRENEHRVENKEYAKLWEDLS